MKIERLSLINQIVEKFQEYKKIKPPISDIRTFIKSLGGIVEFNETMGKNRIARISFFFDSVSDSDVKAFPFGKFTIAVTKDDYNDSEVRFSIIRELGHLFLHRGFYADKKYLNPVKGYRDARFSLQQENEATEFANAFLMPADQYKKRLNKESNNKKINFESIASYFRVSEVEVRNRKKVLENLNRYRDKNSIPLKKVENSNDEDRLFELQSLLNHYMLLKDNVAPLKKSKVRGVMLFVSFDIINSTLYKTHDKDSWPQKIADIFESIRVTFQIAFQNSIIWRILGDEIIYIVPLKNANDLTENMDKVYDTLQEVIFDTRERDNTNLLSLKAAAWIAYVTGGKDIFTKKFPQFCNICVNYYMNFKSTGRVIEFLGNDVDIGFRIKAQAFKGELLISFELARLLIEINKVTATEVNEISNVDSAIANKIYIIGFEKLKGIWNGRPYPIICYSTKKNKKDNMDKQASDYDEGAIISNLSYELFEENPIIAKYRDYVFGRGAYPQEFFTNSKKATERICRDNHLEDKIDFLQERLSEGAYCEL